MKPTEGNGLKVVLDRRRSSKNPSEFHFHFGRGVWGGGCPGDDSNGDRDGVGVGAGSTHMQKEASNPCQGDQSERILQQQQQEQQEQELHPVRTQFWTYITHIGVEPDWDWDWD